MRLSVPVVVHFLCSESDKVLSCILCGLITDKMRDKVVN